VTADPDQDSVRELRLDGPDIGFPVDDPPAGTSCSNCPRICAGEKGWYIMPSGGDSMLVDGYWTCPNCSSVAEVMGS
jgi:hypothetical protein